MKTLLVDNYDSYTYNLFQLLSQVCGEAPTVIKNDEMTFEEACALPFEAVILSPGPGRPERQEDFGLCRDFLTKGTYPLLGVCLGFQGLCEVFGGTIRHGERPMHGHISKVRHSGKNLYQGIRQDFCVTRYHSLVADIKAQGDLIVDAVSEDGVIMGVHHKDRPFYGVQFHPESIMTEEGKTLVENFIKEAEAYHREALCFKKVRGLPDPVDFYVHIKARAPYSAFFDSVRAEKGLSRFSIYALGKTGFFYDADRGVLTKKGLEGQEQEEVPFYTFLKRELKNRQPLKELPCDFQLGLCGYLGYELKNADYGDNIHKSHLPDASLFRCDRAVICDLLKEETYILSDRANADFLKEAEALLKCRVKEKERIKEVQPEMHLEMDKAAYQAAIKKCQAYIRDGESYEICLTNRLIVEGAPDPVAYYRILREKSPAPMSALLSFGAFSVASSSMETFLKVTRDGTALTKPIKGTARRGKTPEEDQAIKNALGKDEKTLGENLMIADLLRNDLGKISETGSVRVPGLMQVETYKNLHQLVTTVTGKIKQDVSVGDAIRALFPGGSMTGAPKKRTLSLIDGLEKSARGIYSGAIGLISDNGTCDLSIVIRTAVIEKDRTTIGIGGAITALSDAEEEFDEIMLKARGNIKTLETYYQPGGETREGC